jgi:transcriptional regulator with XRE-family HTH domain
VPEALSAAVAEQIRRLMAAHKVKPNALAKAVGMAQSSMSRKVNDLSPFDLDDVQKISAYFGVDPADVVAWAQRGVQVPPKE